MTSGQVAGGPVADPAARTQGRTGRRWAALARALAVILASLAILGGVTLFTASPPAPRSLNTKTACVYTRGKVSALSDFAVLVGRPMNCVLLYNDSNTTWSQWANPWFTQPKYGWRHWLQADPQRRRVVLSQELVPDQVPSNWRELGAAGRYDRYARQLATTLVSAGMGDAVIRLGHEMNGTWYHDSLGNDPAQYGDWTAYWARIVEVMRSVPGADFLFDWNVNAGYRPIPFARYYPGDGVVDVIGIDIYDSGMPGDPRDAAVRWKRLQEEPGGLDQIVAFAREHGKPLSFPEWGVVSTADGGLGDDPVYVAGIAATVESNKVLYQAYFDRSTGGVMPLSDAPRSLRTWIRYFGQQGAAGGHPW